tara:strand:- start:45595 stop:46722 length:1128 start_codon:yes stop_codon:yes gene_type:complete
LPDLSRNPHLKTRIFLDERTISPALGKLWVRVEFAKKVGKMKALIFEEHGPISNLKLIDMPQPVPARNEALVRVKAFSLNGFDPMVLARIPTLKTPLPMILGADIAGYIESYAPGVKNGPSVGTRVLVDPVLPDGAGVLGETALGGAREYMCVPAENLIVLPDTVSFEDAAALPIAYGTAHRMLKTRADVKAGDKVLVLGATGGVGICCVQLAKMMGAEVTACTSSASKAEKLKALGADHVINTSEADYLEAVRKLWGKPRVFGESGGADIIVNFIGGDDWIKTLKAARRGGKIVTCGATSGHSPQTDLRYIWSFELNILGSNSYVRDDLISLVDLVASGDVKPVKHVVRPLEELPVSLQEMINRKVFGKCILTV